MWLTICGLAAVLVMGGSAFAQEVVSVKAGMVHYVEGKVFLDNSAVRIKAASAQFPDMKNGGILRTELGRAEVLLSPGMFLRMGEDTTVRMISNSLEDTRIELVQGVALLEVDELAKENILSIAVKESSITPMRSGLYKIDAEEAELRVFDGRADVLSNDKKIEARKGTVVKLDGTLVTAKFDPEKGDTLYRWSNRRAAQLAMASVSSARSIGKTGLKRSDWAWNPYYGLYTFIPGRGTIMSPFGYPYYSPQTVYVVYRQPSSGGGGGGGVNSGSSSPSYNPNLGYSPTSSRSYDGNVGYTAPSSAPAAAASAPAASPRAAETSAPRGSDGGGRAK